MINLKNILIRRAIAFYCDLLIVSLILILYFLTIDPIGMTTQCLDQMCWNDSRILSYQCLFNFVYFLISEYFWNRSLGKLILGLRVKRNIHFDRIKSILIRSLVKVFFPIILIYHFYNREKILLHDLLSKSTVVQID